LTRGYEECWSIPQERLVRVTNIGTGDASETLLRFYRTGTLGTVSSIDLSTVEFFKKPAGVEIPVNFIQIPDFGPYPLYDSAYSSNEVLEAGDSIFIRYYETIDCIDESEYGNYFNENIGMHNRTPQFYLEHPCNSSTAGYSTGNFPYGWRGWEHNYSLKQNFENLNGTILENEELWYDISNATPLILGRGDNKFIFNPDSSELLLRILLDPGLGLVADSVFMCSPINRSTGK
jgi:hypothetical protein